MSVRSSWGSLQMTVAVAATYILISASSASASVLFSNGFETDTAGWDVYGGTFDAVRVASGTNGVISASGGFHAENNSRAATDWGGENFGAGYGVPTAFKEYWTSTDIFLNVGGGWANNTRFDYDSAIGNSAGTELRDFIFNGGFYDATDATAPGAGTNRFVISASNNSQPTSAYPQNPGRGPIAISTTGWYTFEHHFYDDGGVLAVDLSIYGAGHTLVNSWKLSDPGDAIAGVGGNQYGWFDFNQFSTLAFDNTELRDAGTVPEPLSLVVWSALALTAGGAIWWRRTATAA